MHLLLRLHMAQRVAMLATAKHRQLALINPLRAVFAGVIHPQDAGEAGAVRRVAGKVIAHAGSFRVVHKKPAMPTASPIEASKSIIAMEIGRPGMRNVG